MIEPRPVSTPQINTPAKPVDGDAAQPKDALGKTTAQLRVGKQIPQRTRRESLLVSLGARIIPEGWENSTGEANSLLLDQDTFHS